MTTLTLNLSPRTHLGTASVNAVCRKSNQVPGVLYGAKQDTVAIQCNQFELDKVVNKPEFYGHLVTVDLAGKKESVLVKEVQWHHSGTRVLHIDLMRVDSSVLLTTDVQLHVVGEESNQAIQHDGGAINMLMSTLSVRCLPKHLPDAIDVDVSELAMHETLHLGDVSLPKGITLTQSIDEDHNPGVVSIHQAKMAPSSEADEPSSESNEASEAEGDAQEA